MPSNLTNPELDSVPQALAQNGASRPVTGTTNETPLATVQIPKGALRQHGRIRIWCTGQVTANTDTKTLKVKLNGNVIGTALAISASGTSTFDIEANVVNGATPTQNFGSVIGFLGAAVQQGGAAMTVDMTQAQTIQITGQLGTSTDTITLNAYSVEVFNV
jgi:hypothetical protein